jgi:hypothetical protein
MDTFTQQNAPTATTSARKITLTIDFPPNYPIQSRTLDFNVQFTVQEAITYIILVLGLEKYRKAGTVSRLFVPTLGVYLENQEQLCNCKYLNYVVGFFYSYSYSQSKKRDKPDYFACSNKQKTKTI